MAFIDAEAIRTLLGSDDLGWLIERMRRRMSRGEPLSGTMQLASATREQRSAVARLMGRVPAAGKSVSVDLDKLAELLKHSQLCARLEEAVEAVVGPVRDERAEQFSIEQQWKATWETARSECADRTLVINWLEELRTSGLLKRLAASDPYQGKMLLERAVSIVKQIPFDSVRLAELAAAETGNSHALDQGERLGSLVIRYARQLDESASWTRTQERRDAWETLGILCDELSAPVLVLNLRADDESFTGKALTLHAESGEPYRVSVRQLRRSGTRFTVAVTGTDVFVCENPTVVDVAANRLGRQSKPLICIDGQPKTASRLLLDAIAEAGCRIHYHGDFDWDGIRIGNKIMQRHRAVSWRFRAADYLACVGASDHKLKGKPAVAAWDSELAALIEKCGICLHEEQVLDDLIADLTPH